MPEIPTARAKRKSLALPGKVKHDDPAGAVTFPLTALFPKSMGLHPTPTSRRWIETSNLPVWVPNESLTWSVQLPAPPAGTSHATGPPKGPAHVEMGPGR